LRGFLKSIRTPQKALQNAGLNGIAIFFDDLEKVEKTEKIMKKS